MVVLLQGWVGYGLILGARRREVLREI